MRGKNIKIKNNEFILVNQLLSGDKVLFSSWNSIQILNHSCTHLHQVSWVPGYASVRWKKGFLQCYVLKERNAKRISLSLCHWIFYLCGKPRVCKKAKGSYSYVWLNHLEKVLFLFLCDDVCGCIWFMWQGLVAGVFRASVGWDQELPPCRREPVLASSKANLLLAQLSLWVMLVVPLW